MFKKWHSYVSLLVCSCCILSGLFLNTLGVSASASSFSLGSSVIYTYNGIDSAVSVTGHINSISGGGGYISGGSGSISSNSGGGGSISSLATKAGSFNAHVKMPFSIRKSFTDLGLSDISGDEFVKIDTSISSITTSSSGASSFSASNFGLYSSDGVLLGSGTSSISLPTQIYQLSKIIDSSNNVILNYVIEYDVEGASLIHAYQNTPSVTISTTFSGSINCNVATTQEVSNSSSPVTDTKSHELQEKSNTIQEETKTTTHNIFDKISDFFGSFFENIKNALVSVFVPEDGYFSSWFNRLNTLLANKLGCLYAPFNIFIDFINRANTALNVSQNSTVHFPAIKLPMNGQVYTIFEGADVALGSFDIGLADADTSNSSMFGLVNISHAIKRFTDFIFIFCILSLLRKKLNLIIRGGERDN